MSRPHQSTGEVDDVHISMQGADHDVVRLDARRSDALLARDGLQGTLLGG